MHTPVLLSLLVFPPMDENLHDNAFLNRPIHAFCDSVLLRTIWCRIFTSDAAFPPKFDEFFRFELTSIVGSETFQFPTGLVFDHCEPIVKIENTRSFVLIGEAHTFRVESSIKLTKYKAPPSD